MIRAALFAPLLALAAAGSDRFARDDPHAPIAATAIPLDLDDPARVAVGALRFRGGWVLHGASARFGGVSAMAVDGDRFLLVSDIGDVIGFTFRAGRVIAPWQRPLPLLGQNSRKKHRDAEAMALDPASGRVWIATECRNSIWRFAAGAAHAEGFVRPPAMRGWKENAGPESLARLPDGRFVTIAEQPPEDEALRPALIFARDPIEAGDPPLRFYYQPPTGHSPSDATALPDGRLIVLDRRFGRTDGLSAVLSLVDLRGVRAGAVVSGRAIARLARPLAIDNYEALAVTVERGRTMLWIASDDNFMAAERTLLLKFELVGLPPAAGVRPPASSRSRASGGARAATAARPRS